MSKQKTTKPASKPAAKTAAKSSVKLKDLPAKKEVKGGFADDIPTL